MSTPERMIILCEEACRDVPFCKQVMSGMKKEAKKRRCSYLEDAELREIKENDLIVLTGMSRSWFEHAIRKCNEQKVMPIVLTNCSSGNFSGKYHCICADMRDVMERLYKACLASGRTNLALYGVDHASDPDIDRMQIFLSLAKDSGSIYLNSGNLEACFQTFYPHADRYDTVICVNAYAAVSLVRKLEKIHPEILDRIVVISCEEALRYSRYSSRILCVDLNYEAYGTAVFQIPEVLKSVPKLLGITMTVRGTVCEIPVKEKEEEPIDDREFYEDPEIICMARIDQLMMESDSQDHQILTMLMEGNTYAEIAESCFMTEGNVKYRVKKYMTICQVKTKKELLAMLLEYLQ